MREKKKRMNKKKRKKIITRRAYVKNLIQNKSLKRERENGGAGKGETFVPANVRYTKKKNYSTKIFQLNPREKKKSNQK